MAEADWTELGNSLASPSLRRGVTHGITPPNGGGNFVYGWNSMDTTQGCHGLWVDKANFNPMAKGGSIRGAIMRGPSAGEEDFAPLLYMSANGSNVEDSAYILGLSDEDPHRIVLRKGAMASGVPAGAPDPDGTNNIIRRSTETFNEETWLHLRLDVIANPSGDVILVVYRNDLDVNPVTAPVWAAVPGMDSFTDDALGIATGSLPLVGGYAGYMFQKKNVSRRSFVDHVEVFRQLTP
jgi:hypothetical protein